MINNAQPTDDFVFINGRPPVAEFLGFAALAVGASGVDRRVLMDKWREANRRCTQLETDEAGAADNVEIHNPPASAQTLIDRALNDPAFKQSAVVAHRVAIVRADSIVVHQKNINLRYTSELREILGDDPSDEAIFKFALNLDQPVPSVVTSQIAINAYQFSSMSMDLRGLEPSLVTSIPGLPGAATSVGVVVLPVGFSANLLSVVSIEGRLVLHNGSHRAYTLREAGIEMIPAVILEAQTRDELPAITDAPDLLQNPDRYLTSARPPLLRDYFDPQLRTVVTMPRKRRQVTVKFVYEPTIVTG